MAESAHNITRYNSGIHTVEGTVAGSYSMKLSKNRESEAAAYKASRDALRGSHTLRRNVTAACVHAASLEDEFKKQTVGLQSAEDFKRKKRLLATGDDALRSSTAAVEAEAAAQKLKRARRLKKKKDVAQKKASHLLSFFDTEDSIPVVVDEGCAPASPLPSTTTSNHETPSSTSTGEEVVPGAESVAETASRSVANSSLAPSSSRPLKPSLKNPSVDTTFLPDVAREAVTAAEVLRLETEWDAAQEVMKNEMLTVTYSYFDGSGHRKTIKVLKKTTIGQYLRQIKAQLSKEFPSLKNTSADALLYVKEDLIIPHHVSFYDLIVTRARGKSGPLFCFDVHDDIRLVNDIRVEKNESHPGKVVDRHWYEKNKHIFPASRWETYDPNVKRDRYTIKGK